MENCSMCRCGKETVRVSSTLLFTLSYPDSTGKAHARMSVQLPAELGLVPAHAHSGGIPAVPFPSPPIPG